MFTHHFNCISRTIIPICAARLRTRLGRVPASILRTQTKRSFSTSKPTSNSRLYDAIAASGASIPATLWWLNTIRDDVPYLENVSTEHLLIDPGPDEEQVTRILSQDSQSFLVRDVAGITRYDCAQLASNNPCEDRLIHGKFHSLMPNNGWHGLFSMAMQALKQQSCSRTSSCLLCGTA